MPRASGKKTQPNPEAVYVCWQSGSVLTEGGEEVQFVRHQRLFGDSPQVVAAPQFFVRDGDESPAAWDEVVARNEAEQPPDERDVTARARADAARGARGAGTRPRDRRRCRCREGQAAGAAREG